MKIICLVENTVGNEICQTEHGLSLYIEMENHTFLVDTGASGLFLENAIKLGVDLRNVNALFLSHGHYDHGGGIMDFHRINPKAAIVMQKKAFGDYWHKSISVEKYIGLNPEIKEIENLILLNGKKRYQQEQVQIFTLNTKKKEELKCWPEGNLVLKEKRGDEFVQDCFEHEQYIVLREEGKAVLISGCAHNGILNILEEYRGKYKSEPDVIISGFHMRKKNGYSEKDVEVVKETATILKSTGILCYTGHCTGEEPYHWMKEIMGEQLQYIHCGDKVEI